jgi:hypothetical protein
LLCWVGINFSNIILVLVLGSKADFLTNVWQVMYPQYWEHPWGTHWEPREHIGSLMGTHLGIWREHVGNTKEKWKKNPDAKSGTCGLWYRQYKPSLMNRINLLTLFSYKVDVFQ